MANPPLLLHMQLPHIHIIATGGTIAGKLSGSGHGYDAGQVGIDVLLASVPELSRYAVLDYEQFCNIGSQNMNEQIWLNLAGGASTPSWLTTHTMPSS